MEGRGGDTSCNESCGCPYPCPGGVSCRCDTSAGGGIGEEHKKCSCGAHCGCNPCTCSTVAVVGVGKAYCKCGEGCVCVSCAS